MELGQMLFGTGSVNQHEAYWATDGLVMLAEIIAEHRNDKAYGELETLTSSMGAEVFDNEVFTMRPYYWGDCECGFVEELNEWEENNPHYDDCYQTFFRSIHYRDGDESYLEKREHGYPFECDCVQVACEKFGIDPEAPGAYVHCTCGWNERRKEWFENHEGHSPECRIDKPNFVYKPTGVEISWYKHAARGITCNKKQPTATRWFEVISHCVQSLKEES